MYEIIDTFDNIDWLVLRDQKSILFNLTHHGWLEKPEIDAIKGVLNLLDCIQDYAVEILGIKEETVFCKLEEE